MDKKVAEYLEKQKSPQKEICLALREIFLRTLPRTKEVMKWGAIVYDGGRYYIGVVKYGVNLGFAVGGLSKEETRQFEGSGRRMRHIKIEKVSDIDEIRIMGLIKLVHKKASCKPC